MQYLDAVATDNAVSALKPNSKGDFARASGNFTLSAANSSTGVAISVHAGDLLICASIGTPNTWTVSHGGEEGVVSISNGTGIAVNNTNPASPVISLTSDYVNEIAKITNKVDKENGKGLSTEDFTTTLKTKLEGISEGATNVTVDSELTSTGTNPVQGKAIYSTINTLEGKVDNKVDKVDGKELSSNDYTDDEKTKLAGLKNYTLPVASTGALGGIRVGYDGTTEKTYAVKLDANNKAYVEVPWENTTYTNGNGLTLTGTAFSLNVASSAMHGGIKLYNDKLNKEITPQAATDTNDRYYRIQLDNANRAFVNVPWENTVYTHPAGSAASKTSGFYKFSTDATSHISGVTAVTKEDITGLGIPGSDTNTFRPIKVNGEVLDAEAPLNLKNGTNISLVLEHGTDNEDVTINHAGPGDPAQNTADVTATNGDPLQFGGNFYVPKFAIDANGHTRDLGRIKYTLPSPETYSLSVATQTTLGGIKAGNGDNFMSGAESTTRNYKAQVEVDDNGLATVGLENLIHDSDEADHSLGWGIEAGYTYIDVVRLSTDKLVQGSRELVLNGGGANL